jgi:hypothetical protein
MLQVSERTEEGGWASRGVREQRRAGGKGLKAHTLIQICTPPDMTYSLWPLSALGS